MRRLLAPLLLTALIAFPARADEHLFACPEPATPLVGTPTCTTMHSDALGGTTAFSYYIPPACDPGREPRPTCPVLYLLHGHGGSHRQHLDLDSASATYEPGVFQQALTAGPPVDPAEVDDPWTYSDPATWVDQAPLDVILIGPHGQTVPGGHGPAPGVQGFWVDWNPKYANGGNPNGYEGPPPRFETFVVDELIPAVEDWIPTAGRDRAHRGIIGTALGAFGSVGLGLKHPDAFAAVGSVSGALNFLLVPWLDPSEQPMPGLSPPAPVPYVPAPGIAGHPGLASLPGDAGIFATVFLGLGDPVGDHAYYRGNTPRDLAMNARVWDGDTHALHLRSFVNDSIPRRAEDVQPPGYFTDQAFEPLMLSMNLDMEAAYDSQGVPRHFELHPGLHSDVYRWAWLRSFLEGIVGNLGETAPPAPSRFDHRSIATDFEVFGWHVRVEREPVEFLHLRGVSCDGTVRLRGTGIVTIEVPATVCPDRGFDLDLDGSADVAPVDGVLRAQLDLGPSQPTDEPLGAGALPAYGSSASFGVVAL